ncbi:restriction endonuclease [Acinetobacter sp. ANC 4779]|uniref:restriction endonuclease n=1 Tax=Acinetobacter sp. ANC 4779 TaxID=2529848 RepID=UPI00103C533E|nr:restriction endonuclease [Acinetobacter sp. ANC 4779]TCB47344.1 restriction endonuclease [Acinetobacter sp. ANC 4779]
MNILLVRSHISIIEKDRIGYGWSKVQFSEFSNLPDLIQEIKQQYVKGIGRSTNRIKRFFNLSEGDIVVVPLTKSIAIGIVSGKKSFDITLTDKKGCNLVDVSFFRTNDGHILRIPRKSLTTALESRLKVQSHNVNLKEFRDEIERIVESISSNGTFKQESYLLEKIAEAEVKFKENLLKSLTTGSNWLAAGGDGLELLILELLTIEGYTAKKQAKGQSSDISDIDIKASKVDRFSESNLVFQIKHHNNISSKHGLNQLIAYSDSDDIEHEKWFITTGNLSESSVQYAEDHNIKFMIGSELVDWIYENLSELSFGTKHLLGIIEIPILAT